MNEKNKGRMIEGKVYVMPDGTVGEACRHPLHEQGAVAYITTAEGDLWAVYPHKMREATGAEARRYRRRLANFEAGCR